MMPKKFEDFLKLFVKDDFLEFEKKGKHYYLKNDSLRVEGFENQSHSLVLGSEKGFFEPSLFLLELLSGRTKNKVFVNEEAEWLFLCGRNVFLDNILKDASKEKVFLVQNEKDENLGLGIKTKVKGKKVIKNLLDRGDFLRREK